MMDPYRENGMRGLTQPNSSNNSNNFNMPVQRSAPLYPMPQSAPPPTRGPTGTTPMPMPMQPRQMVQPDRLVLPRGNAPLSAWRVRLPPPPAMLAELAHQQHISPIRQNVGTHRRSNVPVSVVLRGIVRNRNKPRSSNNTEVIVIDDDPADITSDAVKNNPSNRF